MRWSGGYVYPQLGGGAGPGGVLRREGAGGPSAAPSLACASSRTPAQDQLPRGTFLEGHWDGVPFASSLPLFRWSL